MASAPSFEQRKVEYARLWSTMKVHASRVASVDKAARTIIASRSRYENVTKQVGTMPWYVVGAIHHMEASNSFGGVLHNGEHIIGTGRKTKLVPAGRGPFKTWEEAALDALKMPPHSLHLIKEWSIERILYELEKYNGWGYWYHGDHSSAYLWAGSNIDPGGKYIADHVWSSTAQSDQNGAALVMKRVLELTSQVASVGKPANEITPPTSTDPIAVTAKVDPQKQIGGILSSVYSAIQSVLKRKD